MKKVIIISLLLAVIFYQAGIAQEQDTTETSVDDIGVIDFSIPSSPAFTLLDVNPEKITKPGFAKDFKLDWILKEGKIVSDIALQFQPVWVFGFDKVSASKYRKLHWALRTLSTLNLSLGTSEKDSTRSMAFSVKLTFKPDANDPLMDADYLSAITPQTKAIPGLNELKDELNEILEKLADSDESTPKAVIQKLKKDSVKTIEKRNALYAAEVKRIAETEAKHQNRWNTNMVDVGFGAIYNYNSPAPDSLKLENQGFGFWINGATGFGKSISIAAIFKQVELDAITERLYGFNFRYGSRTTNFYLEFAYEKIGSEDEFYTFGYGGQHILKKNIIVKFGLQTEYWDKFELKSLIPKIGINWALLK